MRTCFLRGQIGFVLQLAHFGTLMFHLVLEFKVQFVRLTFLNIKVRSFSGQTKPLTQSQ